MISPNRRQVFALLILVTFLGLGLLIALAAR
jgi:hypothetical protein